MYFAQKSEFNQKRKSFYLQKKVRIRAIKNVHPVKNIYI